MYRKCCFFSLCFSFLTHEILMFCYDFKYFFKFSFNVLIGLFIFVSWRRILFIKNYIFDVIFLVCCLWGGGWVLWLDCCFIGSLKTLRNEKSCSRNLISNVILLIQNSALAYVRIFIELPALNKYIEIVWKTRHTLVDYIY